MTEIFNHYKYEFRKHINPKTFEQNHIPPSVKFLRQNFQELLPANKVVIPEYYRWERGVEGRNTVTPLKTAHYEAAK